MKKDELNSILDSHHNWLSGNGGERADLSRANLSGANLSNAYLGRANLSGADLSGADLRRAYLRGAYLSGAYLRRANLSNAYLSRANLRGANLSGADLRYANLSGADLRGADLSGADLRYADLRGADLRGTTGNLAEIKSIFAEEYPITYTAAVIQIGCENHAISDWWGFDDERISKMDKGALDWWQKWKPVLQQIIDMSPATPTGHEEEQK